MDKQDYVMEIGPMGPIGEHESLIIRATKNCPWNRCLFCSVYKGKRFVYRKVSDIKRDIDVVRRVKELVEETSYSLGMDGRITEEVIWKILRDHPEIYGRNLENRPALSTLSNVLNWMVHGQKRCFLQDANSLIIRPKELLEILRYLKECFPSIIFISTYARSKTCAQRSPSELRELKDAGLSWVYVGIESGCDKVLEYMKKGVTQREHISGGRKVIEAGINYAAFVMPGLGGKLLSKEHIEDTIRVLNEIRPHEIRIRSLAILRDSPLYERWRRGEFEAPTEEQMVSEIEQIINGIRFDCIFETLQLTNVLFNVKDRLSRIKNELLRKIMWYKSLPPYRRLSWELNRYLYNGYVDYLKSTGRYDLELENIIEEAKKALANREEDMEEKVKRAIFEIKSRGIP